MSVSEISDMCTDHPLTLANTHARAHSRVVSWATSEKMLASEVPESTLPSLQTLPLYFPTSFQEIILNESILPEARELAEQFRACAALTGDPSLVPSSLLITHLTTTCNSSSGESDALFWLLRASNMAHIHICKTYIHIQ